MVQQQVDEAMESMAAHREIKPATLPVRYESKGLTGSGKNIELVSSSIFT